MQYSFEGITEPTVNQKLTVAQKLQLLIIDEFEKGNISGGTDNSFASLAPVIREHLLVKADYTCSLCGFKDFNIYTGKPVIDINHKDENPFNHVVSNLEALCPNCHRVKTRPWRIDRNNKHNPDGRKAKMLAYAEGRITLEELRGNNLPTVSSITKLRDRKKRILDGNKFNITKEYTDRHTAILRNQTLHDAKTVGALQKYHNKFGQVPVKEGFKVLANKLYKDNKQIELW